MALGFGRLGVALFTLSLLIELAVVGSDYAKALFKDDTCQHNCSNPDDIRYTRLHTLCETVTIPKCDRYTDYDLYKSSAIQSFSLEDQVMLGHNGLRNRVAGKMRISGMVQMFWDDDLAHMAFIYFKMCAPYDNDFCTIKRRHMLVRDKLTQDSTTEGDEYDSIAQNRFQMSSTVLPTDLVERALHFWYHEKRSGDWPTIINFEDEEISIASYAGENNFTQMFMPLTVRVGCAAALADNRAFLICNYFPSPRNFLDYKMLFRYGEPVSDCPPGFPLRHLRFNNLCSQGGAYRLAVSLLMLPLACFICFSNLTT